MAESHREVKITVKVWTVRVCRDQKMFVEVALYWTENQRALKVLKVKAIPSFRSISSKILHHYI